MGVIMANLRVCQTLVVFCLIVSSCQGTTHWIVTEEGLITQQLDSVFNMREPFNLLAILGQEQRSNEVSQLEDSLRVQKAHIEANEDKDTDLEQRFLETDPDCVAAGRPLSEFELYISTALSLEQKGINPLDHLKMLTGEVKKLRQPNCTRVLDLPYSIHAFDHIKAIQERNNISSFPEPELMYLLPSVGSLENAGHMIYKAMAKNKTSWVLFNLAAYYWRVKGHPEQVVECSRRALHHSPHEHRNIPLLNVANVLHRGHLSSDAAILAEAALHCEQEIDIVYFTLGNIYAAVGEYNKSGLYFGHTARINPALGAAEKRQHAVMCHQKLEGALEAQHLSLQRTLAELKEYQTKQEQFLELQKKMLSYQRKAEDQYEANLSYQKHRFLQEMGENPHCEVSQLGSGTQFLMCRRDGIPESEVYGPPLDEEEEIEVLDESRFQNNCVIFPNGEKNCLNLSYEELKTQKAEQVVSPGRPAQLRKAKPIKIQTPEAHWCQYHNIMTDEWDNYAQRIVPYYHNNSLEVLKTNLHVSGEIPAYEMPTCQDAEPLVDGNTGVDYVEGIARRAELPRIAPPIPMMLLLREFLDRHLMHGKEFDYRIKLGTMSVDIKDRWLVLSGISVYWRIHGSSLNAIECLRRSLYHAPPDRVDVPLTNLALVLLDHGLAEDAIEILNMLLVANTVKPHTRYFLACLYMWIGRFNEGNREALWSVCDDPECPDGEDLVKRILCVMKTNNGHDKPRRPDIGNDCLPPWKKESETDKKQAGSSQIGDAVPACVQGPPTGPGSVTGPPGVQPNPRTQPQTNFKSCDAGSVPSTAFGPQTPALPAPDVDVPGLLRRTHLHWPTLEECSGFKKLNLKAFYSTWVSISAKDMKLEDFVDFQTPLTREELEIQPYCNPHLPTSMHTLDHIPAMAQRTDLNYEAEQGLKEVIQTISGGYMDVDEVGARIALLLKKDPESWVATNMAALYWRIEGKSENALDCLRHALHYSPNDMKDLAMVSIANIFHRVGMQEDAATIASMAIEISPNLVINHFTLANIYSSKGQWDLAMEYYESTLNLQPDFQPAIERLRTIQCSVLHLTQDTSQP